MYKGTLCNVALGVTQALELPEEVEVLFQHFHLWVCTKKLVEDDRASVGDRQTKTCWKVTQHYPTWWQWPHDSHLCVKD